MRWIALFTALSVGSAVADPIDPSLLDRQNRVFQAILDFPLVAEASIFIPTYDAPEGFSEAVMRFEKSGVLDEVAATDMVGMSYAPPFFVHFTDNTNLTQAQKASFGSSPVFLRKYAPGDISTIDHSWDAFGLYFMMNDDETQSQIDCAAMVTIEVLYTGVLSQDEGRADCLRGSDD